MLLFYPFVFILVAGFAAVVTRIYGKILGRMNYLSLMLQTIRIFIILLILIWSFLTFRIGESIILYVGKVQPKTNTKRQVRQAVGNKTRGYLIPFLHFS